MAVFRCKMCGGALDIKTGETVAECRYCDTKQTLPRLNDDRRANLFDRANHLRRNSEFDKAEAMYEQLLIEDGTDAETYWSLVLCRYGVEYVKDPVTHKQIPTVNRAQYTSVFDDGNYKEALRHADAVQRELYEQEANTINEIQKSILAISQKEKPFDVFICYKETDQNGRRTMDSVLAQELYYQLKNEGYKVFFSRITLEDKLGSAYEPYIFAALNSAKVMVVVGTSPAHFQAVWVKNEWSRYLGLIRGGAQKTLIPAYKDMDPYDLPDEFSHLQAQDMSKLGFMQDLTRGIKKLVREEAVSPTTVSAPATVADISPMLKRALIALEDGEFENADMFSESALDNNPENAMAYVIKLMAECRVKTMENLLESDVPLEESRHYKRAVRFADAALKAKLEDYNRRVCERVLPRRQQECYQEAQSLLTPNADAQTMQRAADLFQQAGDYADAHQKHAMCQAKADELKKAAIYTEAMRHFEKNTKTGYAEAKRLFEMLPGYRHADTFIRHCDEKYAQAPDESEEKPAAPSREQRPIAAYTPESAEQREARLKKVLKKDNVVLLTSTISYSLILLVNFAFLVDFTSYLSPISYIEMLFGHIGTMIVPFSLLGITAACTFTKANRACKVITQLVCAVFLIVIGSKLLVHMSMGSFSLTAAAASHLAAILAVFLVMVSAKRMKDLKQLEAAQATSLNIAPLEQAVSKNSKSLIALVAFTVLLLFGSPCGLGGVTENLLGALLYNTLGSVING